MRFNAPCFMDEDDDELKSQDNNLDATSTSMATELSNAELESTTDSTLESLCTQPPGVLGLIKGPVAEDWHKLEQRQKQIDYGKVEMKSWIDLVIEYHWIPPISRTHSQVRFKFLTWDRTSRQRHHPWTPNIHMKCSKRCWDGMVRSWRRKLHLWDPPL
jgi:hypothetical protein